MRPALVDLIARMTLPERHGNSEDSIPWHAHREAEKLSDASIVDELAEYVRIESNHERRRAAYFILGKLGEKCRARECALLLLEQVHKEKNKYALSALFGSLAHITKPSDLDLGPIFAFLRDDRWLVRHAAIQSLVRTDSPESEDRIIDILETTNDPYDIVYCHATLNKIGSTKAIPFIEKNLKSRKRDVKDSARFAIEAIQGRERNKTPS